MEHCRAYIDAHVHVVMRARILHIEHIKMEYNSQTELTSSQENLLADGMEENFLAQDWWDGFSDNENEPPVEAVISTVTTDIGQNSKE